MVRLSICIATYNGEAYIKRQLESILTQIDNHDEIIISDDKSSDNTIHIIEAFRDSRIKIYSNLGKHGPIGNFENALRYCKGKFIFLCDQDDYWKSNKINIIINLLDYYDLVLSDCTVVNKSGGVLIDSFFKFRQSKPGFFRNLYKNSYIGCCMAFRREILEYVLPFPNGIYMHDWWIGLSVELQGRVYFCKEPLINYVRHGNNASPTGESSHHWPARIRNRIILLTSIIKRRIKLFFAVVDDISYNTNL